MSDETDSGATLKVGDTFTVIGTTHLWVPNYFENRTYYPGDENPAPKTLTITAYSAERYDSDWPDSGAMPVTDFIDWLQKEVRKIPPKFRETAAIEIDSRGGFDGDHSPQIRITYLRPETKQEIAARRAGYAAQIERAEAAERAKFEAMKAKYEPR